MRLLRYAIALTITLTSGVAGAQGFVKAEGTKFKLNGGDFYFSGANTFALTSTQKEAEDQFKVLKALGVNVIRIWGFWNGEAEGFKDTDQFGRYVLQSRPGVFPEEGWRKMDYALYQARAHNMKLIIPLLNEWREFGGIDKIMEWAGLPAVPWVGRPYEAEDPVKKERYRFWTHEGSKSLYKAYVNYALNRVNTYTGVAYKDDPTVMIWEVMNEPRYGPWQQQEPNPKTVAADIVAKWLNEMAGYIKSIDKNHMVATGEEGFLENTYDAEGNLTPSNTLKRNSYPWNGGYGEGISFTRNAVQPNIDALSIHGWPFQWNIDEEYGKDLHKFLPEWIDEHVLIAKKVNKPLYLGEFGWQILRRPGSDVPERDQIFKATFDRGLATEIGGIAFWHSTPSHNVDEVTYKGEIKRATIVQAIYNDDQTPHDQEFRFDVFCPEDKTTCQLITDFTGKMSAKVKNPDPPYVYPCKPSELLCVGKCVDPYVDPSNCGVCKSVCQTGEVCQGGWCVVASDGTDGGIPSADGAIDPSDPNAPLGPDGDVLGSDSSFGVGEAEGEGHGPGCDCSTSRAPTQGLPRSFLTIALASFLMLRRKRSSF